MGESIRGEEPDETPDRLSRHSALLWLAGVLAIEALGLALVSVWFLIEILTTTVSSVGGSILIFVLCVAATAWVAATAIATLRAQAWVRAAALTWQLCQLAVAVGAFQGLFAQPAIGFGILAPTVVALILLFLPATTRALQRVVPGDD